jgi:hypothetical protein
MGLFSGVLMASESAPDFLKVEARGSAGDKPTPNEDDVI